MTDSFEPNEPAWRARISEICLSFPEAVESDYGPFGHLTFKVRDKIFAYYMMYHHDDGRIAIWCKGQPGVQEALLAADSERFFRPPYVGPKGWIGIRLDGQTIDWEETADLLEMSYRMTAAKRQIAMLDAV